MFDTITQQRVVGQPNRHSGYQGEVQIQNIAQENSDGFYQLAPVRHNNMQRSWHHDTNQTNNMLQEQHRSTYNTGRRLSQRQESHRHDHRRTEPPQRYEQPNIHYNQNHHHHPTTRQVKSHDGYQTLKQSSSHRSNKSAPSHLVRTAPSVTSEQTLYEQPQNVYSPPKRHHHQPQDYNNENRVIYFRKPPPPTQPQTRLHKKTVQEIPYEHFNIQSIKPPQTFQPDRDIPIQHEWEIAPVFVNTLQRSQHKQECPPNDPYTQERLQKKPPSVCDQVDNVEYVIGKPPRPSKLALVTRNSAPSAIARQSSLRKPRTPSMTFGDDFKISLGETENENIETFRLKKAGNGEFNWESGEDGRGLPFPTDDQLNMMLTDGQRTIRSSLKKSQSGRHGNVRKRVTIQERVPSYQALLFP